MTNSIKSLWIQLSLRQQLNIIISFILFTVFIVVTVTNFFITKHSLIEKSFSLLEINQKHTLKKIYSLPQNKDTLTQIDKKGYLLDRTGLGRTGETYIVDLSGSILTKPRFTSSSKIVKTPKEIINHWQGIKTDYRGVEVLAVWTKFKANNQEAYLVSEIDLKEATDPAASIFKLSTVITIIILFAFLIFSSKLSQLLSNNVEQIFIHNRIRQSGLIEGQEQERN